jgi:hypothetical protein
MDQIVRIAFQRKQAAPSFTTTSILVQATWTPLLSAVGDTKVVLSPLIPGMVIPPSEILENGGNDNTTINGIPELRGIGFTKVTAQLQSESAAIRVALRKLAAESALTPGFTNLWGYFINKDGQVIGSLNGSNVEGFPIYNVAVGDPGTEGYLQNNKTNFSFALAGGWADSLAIYNPTDFNPVNL